MADYEIRMDFSNLLMGVEQINVTLANNTEYIRVVLSN
jgi:hypothetical protein